LHQANKMKQECYKAAAYLRLSRDEEDPDGKIAESSSIRSQRDMICAYARKHDDIKICGFYVDEGWSGVSFERPAFTRMMEDIVSGSINCVIVKDLSRLGRDYIEAGRLVQKTFPAFSVRFVSLTDQYDSLTAGYQETSLIIPIKNFVNDAYSRDISIKVRSCLKAKREKGEFTGAFCPYGYEKSENRNILIPDRYAACIVRQIFYWKMEGYSCAAIAEKLDAYGILAPADYKKCRGENFETGFAKKAGAGWTGMAVKRILTNEIYCGVLIQGKREKVNYKLKKVKQKKEEDWARTEQAHAPVLSREDYLLVQELLQSCGRPCGYGKKAHKYSGLVFCGDCGAPMILRPGRYQGQKTLHLVCANGNRNAGCTRHSISWEILDNLVLAGLRLQVFICTETCSRVAAGRRQDGCHLEKSGPAQEGCCAESFSCAGKHAQKSGSAQEGCRAEPDICAVFEQEIKQMSAYAKRCRLLCDALREDWKQQLVSKEDYEDFLEIYTKEHAHLCQAVQRQRQFVKELRESKAASHALPESIMEQRKLVKTGRMLLLAFVKKICIYEDRRVYVQFRFREGFSREGQDIFGGDLCQAVGCRQQPQTGID